MYSTIIHSTDLAAHLSEPDWVIVDCRYQLQDQAAGFRGYREGHIPRAIFADLLHDLSAPPATRTGRHPLPGPERLSRLFTGMGIGSGRQVVAYDDAGGSMAARLWWMLRYMGHQPVAVLDGGWQAWLDTGLAVETGQRVNPPLTFTGTARHEWLVTLEHVLEQELLVDSREPARFRGEEEPLDPVAGHIPGARNRCWRENLDEDGKFRAPAEVRGEMLALFGDISPTAVTFYCGSGVTACHNLLAAAWAGLPVPRLYAGSWSEWCADPARPISSGD